jgi:tetratricopeptide (TPR) repeat protein
MSDHINAVTKQIEENPNNAELYILRGMRYASSGSKKKAKTDFDRAIELESNRNPSEINENGVNSNPKDDVMTRNLIKELTFKISKESKKAELYVVRGKLYAGVKNKKEARADFYKAIELGGESEKEIYFEEKPEFLPIDDHLEELTESIETKVNSNEAYGAYKERANYFREQKNDANMLSEYDKIIELSESFADDNIGSAFFERGLIHNRNGYFDKAISDLCTVKIKNDQLIEKQLKSDAIVRKKDLLITKIDSFIDSLSDNQDSSEIDPNSLVFRCRLQNALAYKVCCEIHHKQNNKKQFEQDFKIAENEFNEAISQKKLRGIAFLLKGNFYLQFEKIKEAEENFNKAIESCLHAEIAYVTSIGQAYSRKGYALKSYDLYYPISKKVEKESINATLYNRTAIEISILCKAYFDLGLSFDKEENYKMTNLCMREAQLLGDYNFPTYGEYIDLAWYIIEAEKYIIRNTHYIELSKKNQALEEKSFELEKAKEELEDIMAMFAHKFRGPLQNIIWNVDHSNQAKVSQEAVKTMSGLLDIFSAVSTSSEYLLQKLIADKKGDSSVIEILRKSVILAVSQALSQRNIQKSRQHYINFAKQKGLVPVDITRQLWNEEFYELEASFQKDWETEFMDFLDLSDPVSMLDWIEQHFCKFKIKGFDDDKIQFQKYGPKESIMIIIFVEMLLNALKYYDSDKKQPIRISWKSNSEHYDFVIENPSSPKERDIDKGSGKGHHFLKKISKKLDHEMPELVFADMFIVSFPFNNNILI